MTILQRIETAAAEICTISGELGRLGEEKKKEPYSAEFRWAVRAHSLYSRLLLKFDDLQAAMIEYQTGQAPTPLPARTPLTDAWEDPKASMSFLRSLNNDGVSDEYDQEMGLHEALADFKDRDIEPRD